MASSERWYFDLEQIHSTPSIKCGYDHDKELSCRQQAANFIQDMGQRLQVNQLCINTAIVYMHRFYMFHSFQRFHRTSLASASLFLAAKVEEQPRKLEHVIRFAQICLHRDQMPFDVTSQAYMEQVQDLIMNENILLQTLGFDVAIDHPHTHIVRCCQLVRASKDLAQTSYFMASYSLHLTTMCLQYKPTVVACFCIHLACKWSNWEIPESSEGRQWFWYVDKSVTSELLESLTAEFLNLFEKCPSRLKKKIMALSSYSNMPSSISNAPQGPPTQIPMSQAEIDKKKESRIAVESHNPMNSVPLPIGPLGVAVAEANSLQGVQTHPFIHQNTIVARHNSCSSESLMKKHHYEHAGPTQRTQIVGPPPPPLPLDQPYKKLHHPPHHQRENHSIGMQGGAKLPSCMFDVGVVPAPPHKAYPQHGSAHVNPPAVHPAASRTTNHVPTAHRPPSRPHVRNGEAHYPDKKLPLEVKPVETKLPQVVTPSIPVAARVKPKTPPNQLSLEPVVPPVKMERSIFSPEEKACSPPPPPPPSRVHEKPKICSPVVIKKESPHTDPPTLPQASAALPSQDTKPSTHPPLNTGDAASRERVTSGVPLPAPDTPSKSSHAKKKKKKHKEHKDKHKDKHKHKHRVKDPEPIVITIPKEKITISHPEGLKIKIAKEKISAPPAATTGLKLKISKDKLKKRERGSGGEEDDVQQPSKQHRPNGTAVLQVTLSNTFSSVLGKSILSPIRTPNFSNKYDSSPQTSPSHIPKYSPTQSGDCKPPLCIKTPGHHDPVYSPRSSPTNPCLSPIAATPRYSSPPSRSLSTQGNYHSNLEGDPAVSPLRSQPFLSPIAATPRHTSSTKQFKSPPQVETLKSQVTELSHMSPIQSKPFLSPIAATPRHIPKIKKFKSPPRLRGDISHPGDSEMPHLSPIRSKPFLSPLAPTPRHSSKTKTFKSPPTNHVYVPLAQSRSRPVELSHMSPVQSKPFLSPIAPTPRYPSPKQKSSPPPKYCYIPISETEESSASSVSPVSSTHSSLEHSDYEEESKVSSPIQFCSSPKMSGAERPLSPVFNPSCDQDYHEDKKLLSPIQTPAYVPEMIKSPHYVPEKVYQSPVDQEAQSPLYKDNGIQSPPHSSDKLGSPTSSSETIVSPEEHCYDSDSGSISKSCSEKHSNYNSDKESMHDDNMMIDSSMDDFSNKYTSSPLETSSHSPAASESDKEQMVSCKSSSPDLKTDEVIQVTPVYEEYRPYGKNIDCSSPLGTLENGGKCLLSPIMTPGRSPVRGESPEGKPTSPAIIPRYSPTDPNSFGCEPTGVTEQGGKSTDRIREASPSGILRRGPHTPPSPLQNYDPITPARPDPNEIIFKDSNDNHTERSSPGLLKKPYDRRFDEDRPYQRKHPLLPDFKIPRTTNRPRRHPGQDSIGPWPNRGRGRGGHFYPRSRGRGARFELPGQHHYRHPHRMPPHYEHDRGRAFYHRGQDMQRYETAPPDHQVQRFDPSLVLQGNAYDAAIMKHAYETMGVPPEYFMHHYHQVYIPAYPPPPPLPEEPPPQPPPPPPPPH